MFKRLFFVSASLLMLAIAHQLGTREARAQSGSQIVGFGITVDSQSRPNFYVITSTGDLYDSFDRVGSPRLLGNYWGGGTVSIQPETWTGMKEKYRK